MLAYFPSGTWYSLTGHPTVDASDKGETLELDVPLGKVAVHVLGGSIIPMQVGTSNLHNLSGSLLFPCITHLDIGLAQLVIARMLSASLASLGRITRALHDEAMHAAWYQPSDAGRAAV